jgi:hypothetical protein
MSKVMNVLIEVHNKTLISFEICSSDTYANKIGRYKRMIFNYKMIQSQQHLRFIEKGFS